MGELQVAKARANFDGLRKDQLVRIDPEKWIPYLEQGLLTLVEDVPAELGYQDPQPGRRAKIV